MRIANKMVERARDITADCLR